MTLISKKPGWTSTLIQNPPYNFVVETYGGGKAKRIARGIFGSYWVTENNEILVDPPIYWRFIENPRINPKDKNEWIDTRIMDPFMDQLVYLEWCLDIRKCWKKHIGYLSKKGSFHFKDGTKCDWQPTFWCQIEEEKLKQLNQDKSSDSLEKRIENLEQRVEELEKNNELKSYSHWGIN